MAPRDLDRLAALSRCSSLDELFAATRRIGADLGFEHFIYGVRVATSLTQPYQFVFSGYPKEWRQRYTEVGYEALDPTILHCITRKRVVPVIWDRTLFTAPAAVKLRAEAKAFGLASGASFPVRGPHSEAAMLSLASARDPRAARTDICAVLGQAQLLACYVHEAIARLVLCQEVMPLKQPMLTGRERECLLWAADGKTSWEIGKIIGVSERTVIFHLHNVSGKLGVSNRQHAVARALALGLIAP